MSGKRAAAALMQFDSELAAEVQDLGKDPWKKDQAEFLNFARKAYGLWTVSMAAAAAGVTEEITIAALLFNHIHSGSNLVCQGIAKQAKEPTA